MHIEQLEVIGAWKMTPRKFLDERGYFLEWFKSDSFKEQTGTDFKLAQANCSVSKKGVVRGIHFAQVPPGQAKYITCVSGEVTDVIVDLRLDSPTYLNVAYVDLSPAKQTALYVPSGVGHGFVARKDNSTVMYLCDQPYSPGKEHGINPLDPQLGILWPEDLDLILSDKDMDAPSLSEIGAIQPRWIEAEG